MTGVTTFLREKYGYILGFALIAHALRFPRSP